MGAAVRIKQPETIDALLFGACFERPAGLALGKLAIGDPLTARQDGLFALVCLFCYSAAGRTAFFAAALRWRSIISIVFWCASLSPCSGSKIGIPSRADKSRGCALRDFGRPFCEAIDIFPFNQLLERPSRAITNTQHIANIDKPAVIGVALERAPGRLLKREINQMYIRRDCRSRSSRRRFWADVMKKSLCEGVRAVPPRKGIERLFARRITLGQHFCDQLAPCCLGGRRLAPVLAAGFLDIAGPAKRLESVRVERVLSGLAL